MTSASGAGTWVTGETGGSILGKWHNNVTGETLEFFPNGTVTGTAGDRMGVGVTYAISGDQITISALGTILVTQTFSISGGELTIIDNETGVSGTLQRVNVAQDRRACLRRRPAPGVNERCDACAERSRELERG